MRDLADQLLRLSVAALALAGCVRSSASKPTMSSGDEIVALSAQIDEWRRELLPACDAVRLNLFAFAPVKRFASCDQDSDHCSIAEAICDNAEAICALAGARGNDTWSNDKCVSAKRVCRAARACIE